MNIGIRQAKKQIVSFINGLPFEIEVKRLLIKDIYEDIREEADRVILKEAEALQKELKEKEDDKE